MPTPRSLAFFVVALALLTGLAACGDPAAPTSTSTTSGGTEAGHPILGEASEAVLDLRGDLAPSPLGADLVSWAEAARGAASVPGLAVDYPLEGSVFPPDFAPPTFLWQDDSKADTWLIEVSFEGAKDASILVLVPYAPPPAYEARINEFHYDDAGDDEEQEGLVCP